MTEALEKKDHELKKPEEHSAVEKTSPSVSLKNDQKN